MSILVSGSLAFDKIMNFPGHFADHILPEKIHNLNVSFNIADLRQNFGGTAGNIAYNLSLLQERPIIISTAGNDFEKYECWLAEHKICTDQIKKISDIPSACAYIITDQSDNQITGFHLGAMSNSVGEISDDIIKSAKLAIVSAGNISDMVNLPKQYQKLGLPYIFDPGQAIPALSSDQLKQCLAGAKILIVNDYELSLILNKTGLFKADIISKVEILITTLGEKGSLIEQGTNRWEIPAAIPKNVSDPTGAGDAYRAGLIKGLLLGWPLEKCGRLAATVAVYTVEKYGTQTHEFTWESLLERYKENFGNL